MKVSYSLFFTILKKQTWEYLLLIYFHILDFKKSAYKEEKKPTKMQYMSTKCSEMECKLNS